MRRSKTAAAAALFTVLALLPLAVAPVAAGDAQAKAKAEHQRIVNYWTAERIAGAKPRDFVKDRGRQVRAQGQAARRRRRQHRRLVDPGRPGRPAHRQGAVHDGRRQLGLLGLGRQRQPHDPLAGPHRRALRLRRGNQRLRDQLDLRPLVRYLADVHLRPDDLRLLDRPGLVVDSGFATAGGFNTQATVHDFAFAIVGAGTKGTRLDALDARVGSYPIAYPAISTGNPVHAFGYPAAGRYHGKDLTYCTGNTFNDPNNGNLTWGIACNMTGGSSGGPWLGELHPGRWRHADLAQLVRLQRPQQHVRPQVQREHPGRLQPGEHDDRELGRHRRAVAVSEPLEDSPKLPACPLCAATPRSARRRASSTVPGV